MVGQPLPVVVKSYLGSAEFRSRGLMTPTLNAKPVQLDGYVVYVDPDDPLIGGAIATGYEPEVTRLFLQHMGSGAVLDVGANCGYFSLLARSRGAEVYAIEPWQRNIQLLYASVAANHWDRVHIIAAAASDTLRTLTIGA